MMRKIAKFIVFLLGTTVLLGIIFLSITWFGFREERKDAVFGVTFSTVMVRQLGLEPREVFNAIIYDLGVKKVRLPIYWNDVERERDYLIFDDYDYFIRRSDQNGVKVILAVGKKLPRWPECHIPSWALTLSFEDRQEALEAFMGKVVERYRHSAAVEAWQVENEPFFKFGAGCAELALGVEEVEREAGVIREKDMRPIMLTDSGEQGGWVGAAKRGDILGITLYRQVWSDTLRVLWFPFGPGFYRIKHWVIQRIIGPKRTIVAELQAEPWGPKLLPEYEREFQTALMNSEQLRRTVSYARRTGFDTFYLWGVEWWWWMRVKQNDPSLWDEAKILF